MKVITAFSKGHHWAVVTHDNDWQEYRVMFGTKEVNHHEADYHTDDKDDAIATARAEVKRMDTL